MPPDCPTINITSISRAFLTKCTFVQKLLPAALHPLRQTLYIFTTSNSRRVDGKKKNSKTPFYASQFVRRLLYLCQRYKTIIERVHINDISHRRDKKSTISVMSDTDTDIVLQGEKAWAMRDWYKYSWHNCKEQKQGVKKSDWIKLESGSVDLVKNTFWPVSSVTRRID